ncbi:HIT family protein [Candidatus Woesearchaeota archaeon]|nr:HIT family protein [Candidatus Woesearchaeota archaeon]
MNDCIFCKIVRGELPCYKIYEDNETLAFLDRNPVNPGHTLLIPKKHSETILDTNDETLKKLITTTKKISKAIFESMKLEGFNIGINQFKIAGQVVPHLHIHIMPRHKNDGIKLWPSREYESEKEKNNVQKKITRLLK